MTTEKVLLTTFLAKHSVSTGWSNIASDTKLRATPGHPPFLISRFGSLQFIRRSVVTNECAECTLLHIRVYIEKSESIRRKRTQPESVSPKLTFTAVQLTMSVPVFSFAPTSSSFIVEFVLLVTRKHT